MILEPDQCEPACTADGPPTPSGIPDNACYDGCNWCFCTNRGPEYCTARACINGGVPDAGAAGALDGGGSDAG